MTGMQNFLTFREAGRLGSYAEYPMLPGSFDPQHHLSNNDVEQPFYLICEKDSVLAQMSGSGRLFFKHSNMKYQDLKTGDWIYIPAGTPTRFVPDAPSVQYRMRARRPGLEAVAFYADDAEGKELFRHTWDADEAISQEEYLKACERFNGSEELRTDPDTGKTLDPIDLSNFAWSDVAEKIKAGAEEDVEENVAS